MKEVGSKGQITYGDELTYTLVISAAPGTLLGLYGPLDCGTFSRFVEKPSGVTHVDTVNGTVYPGGAISGALEVTPTNHVTVSFVTKVGVPGTVSWTAEVTNEAASIHLPERSAPASGQTG